MGKLKPYNNGQKGTVVVLFYIIKTDTKNQKGRKMDNKYIRVGRQSLCMGDDCTAPNEKLILVNKKDMLSDILRKVSDCLPQMHNVIWAVCSDRKVIGYIITGTNKQVQYELCLENQVFCQMDIESPFCNYFHQKSFEYINGKDGGIIEKYPECVTLFDKVKCYMKEQGMV